MVEVVVFDFDGVIVESLNAKTEAFRSLFAEYPEHVEEIVRLHEENLGTSRYDKFRMIYAEILEQPLDDETLDRLDREFSRLVFDKVVHCEWVRGAPELLEHLAVDHVLCVASATPQDELRRIVEARRLSHLFRSVEGSPRHKDEIVRNVLERTSADPDDAMFVGDALSDHRAATATGVRFIGRVPPGAPNPFSNLDIAVVADLAELRERWNELAVDTWAGRSSSG